MSEMKRLLDDPIAPELAELLRSAELDAPRAPEERQGRILAAIAAAPAVAMAPAARPAGRLARLWSAGKWGVPVAGLVVAGLVATSIGSSTKHAAPGMPAAAVPAADAPRVESVAAPPAPLAPAETTPSATMRVEDLPSAAVAPQAPRARAADVAAPAADASSTLVDEITIIDQARGALAAHRPAESLARLQSYRSTFATPHFADEADALEIQSLAALNRTTEARQKADHFLATHPQSPYAQRVRSAVK